VVEIEWMGLGACGRTCKLYIQDVVRQLIFRYSVQQRHVDLNEISR